MCLCLTQHVIKCRRQFKILLIFPAPRKSTMAEAHLDPVFQIQRVYLKDVSLEQPNSPEILLNQ
ncbi:MAG TPA: hypothetical protein DCP03_14990, partial [Polaromonas sp.]|nr:hypothetical protein [Polaromonas sp.]